MSFLNVVEIESALQGLAAAYPAITSLVTLPYATAEGRRSHALVIGVGGSCPDVGVLILSGTHAREWGGPDICVNFAADLLRAYSTNSGLTYGGKSFTAAEIASIIKRLKVIVFPNLNPDGRNFSQTDPTGAWWRKNRNLASSTPGQPSTIGVDLNRNYDFLWDFGTAFAPGATAGGTLASTSPGHDLFHGTAPFSEAETRNVRWLFKYSNISRFVDIHSYGGDILHPWGDDENQTTDPSKNFTNAAWNGQRGLIGGAYGEYMTEADRDRLAALGASMAASIAAVRGENYSVDQSFFLPSWSGPSYPTSGCSDDWVFSRRYTRTRASVFPFTIEFNRTKTFFPTWAQMEPIIRDISAGLIQMCLDAVPRLWRPWIWCVIVQWFYKLWRRVWPWDLWGPYGPWERPLGRPAGPRHGPG